MRRVLTLALLIPALGACGDVPDADVDFGGDDLGPDRFSIVSTGDEVKMALTDGYVYFALSDSAMAEARREFREESEKEGVEGMIGGLVEKTVGKALGFRARYPVDEIRDIRWEDGRMRILFTDPDRQLSEEMYVDDGRPLDEAFREEDVRAFAEAFREVKEEWGAGGG